MPYPAGWVAPSSGVKAVETRVDGILEGEAAAGVFVDYDAGYHSAAVLGAVWRWVRHAQHYLAETVAINQALGG